MNEQLSWYGNVEVLHCYYAHGEDNDNFQRRCYWQLDGPLEHIVLVHYRDLNEETNFGTPQLCSTGSTSQSAQISSVAGSAYINSSTSVSPASCVPSTSNVDLNKQRASSEFEDADFDDELSCVPLPESVPGSGFQVASLPGNIVTEPISRLTGSTFHTYTASSMNTISLNGSVNPFFSNQVTSHNLILNRGQNVHGTSLAAGTFPLAESVSGSGFQVDSLPGNIITEPISVLTGSTFHSYASNSMNTVSLNRSVNPFVLNQVTSHNHILNNGPNIHGTSHAAGTFPLAESVPGFGFQVASLPKNIITEPISVLTGSTFHPYTASSMNTATLNRSVNPFFLNQVASQNLILNKGQNVYGTSPAAGSFGFQFNNKNSPSTCSKNHSLKKKLTITEEQNRLFQQLRCADALSTRTRDSITQNEESVKINVLPEPYSQPLTIDDIIQVEEKNAEVADHAVNNDGASNDSIQPYNMSPEYKLELTSPDSNEHAEEVPSIFNSSLGTDICDNKPGDLEKLDSFGRWMNEELGNDCLMASDSCSCLNAIDTEKDKVFSRDLQLDVGSVAPSLSQEQLFSINDFSPDWACSGAETKVLISGVFLGGIQPSSIKWCCMFGDVEVSAEVLTTNAIRCQAPPHSPGLVPFYITCSNRLACSEVREFEYRENPSGTEISELFKNESEDEIYLQIRFAKMLSLGSDKKRQLCSIENCAKCIVKKKLALMFIDDEPGWEKIEKETKTCQRYLWNLRDALLEKLLKGRLYEWLVCKLHEDGKGPNILDDKGQGAIHLAAALGYEWAMTSIVAAGVNPSFRDARGRTALHWAAYYGREQTIVTLLNLGASPEAIEDPTSKFPVGQTAADLASSSGHKGIAAYLAEADLTGHLTSMSITENVMDSVSASIAAEDAVETVKAQNIIFSDVETEQISLRKSLAAVRNSARAASRIHAAFRAQSFRQRQLTRNAKNSDIACEFMLHPSLKNNPHKMGHFNDYLHASAIKIQQKYRGWKSRKDFLKIRDRIVKIQDIILEENERTRRERISETKLKKKKAHVRGHQVRKQYKKVVWSVGIVEKVILRWRRKGSGLRGFRAEKATGGAEQEVDKADEYDFLHVGRKQKAAGIEKALGRVKSMVRYPEAREQYWRLMECSSKSKVRPVYSLSDQVGSSNEEYLVEDDPFAS